MALPTERTVTGTYTNPVTGAPYDGTSGDNFVIFDPVPEVWTDQGGNQILTGGGRYNLDVNGQFSEELVCTDAANVLPAEGKLWKLRTHVGDEWLPPMYFELPEGDGSPVDITDAVSVTVDGVIYVPVPGPEGPEGPAGAQGADGESAYQVAVDNGFVGTESQWLASLVGPEGPEGPEGPQGAPGEVTEAELNAALAGYAQLAGATFTGLVTINGANFLVKSVDDSKAYRFRQDGGSLDLEGAGEDLFLSVFENGDFTGDQFQYLRLESGAQIAHATGKWVFVDGPFGADVHTLDGFANQVGFHGATPQDQATITGERSTGEALGALLTALGLRGDIVDSSTAGPLKANDADVVKLTGNQTVGGTKTFSLSPSVPTPTTDSEAANKSYVDNEIDKVWGTGVLYGGELNASATPSSVDIGETVGLIVDYISTPGDPDVTVLSIPAQTVALDAGALARTVTWFLADSSGNIIQQADQPTNTQRRTHLQLGVIAQTGGTIFIDQSTPVILKNGINQLYDLMYSLGAFNISGNAISGVAATLQLQKTSGTIFTVGSNYYQGAVQTNDPHTTTTPAQNPISISYATQASGSIEAPVTSIKPNTYDNAGTPTTIGGAANRTTIQRVFLAAANGTANQVIIQYGQQIYPTYDAALAELGRESFTINPNLNKEAVYMGSLVIRRTATDTTDTDDVRFYGASKFGGGVSGSSALGDVLFRSGGTMTGALVLAADPTAALEAATKQYVDAGDATAVKLTGDQTVAGIKTFSSIPVGPASDPTTSNQLTRKTYVDNLDAANVKLTGDQSVAGVKTFSSIPVGPASDPTTANQLTRKSYVDAGDAANAADITTLDGEVVKLTGDQSVAGIKTFTSVPVLPASDPTTSNQAARKAYVDAGDAENVSNILNNTYNVFQPEDLGLVAWTSDPACCQSTIRYESANRIRSASVAIHKTTTVTDIVWYMLGYAGGLLDGSWAAIYNSAGNKVGTVANLEAGGSEPPEVHDAGGAMSGSPLDEGSIVLTQGVYTIVWRFIYNYGTPDGPALLEYENSAAAPPNILSRNGVVRFGYSTASITTPPATIPTLLTDGGNRFWVSLADDS